MWFNIILLIFFTSTAEGAFLPTCDVFEQGDFLCDNPATCECFCKGKYKLHYVGYQCVRRKPMPKPRCVCKIRCKTGGGCGDPHYQSFDGRSFSYQGLSEHYLVKPKNKFASLPAFEVRGKNKLWGAGPMAVVDSHKVLINGWVEEQSVDAKFASAGSSQLTIEVQSPKIGNPQFTVLVNNVKQVVPYVWTSTENFVNVTIDGNEMLLTTSFGLQVLISSFFAGFDYYASLYVSIPAHPDLRDGIHGLLGCWNDDRSDDTKDPNGNVLPADDWFSWAFGNSWIVPGEKPRLTDSEVQIAEASLKKIVQGLDSSQKQNIQSACSILNNGKLIECAKSLGRPLLSAQDCETDCAFAGEKACKEIINGILKPFAGQCGLELLA